jgi:hypothetical protein
MIVQHPYGSDVMLLPDPRFRSPTALSGYGYDPGDTITVGNAFCDSMKIAMPELGNVLEKAYALGLYNEDVVVQGAALWDRQSGFWTRKWTYLPWTNSCANDAAEVMATVDAIRALIQQHTGSAPPLIEPAFKPPASEGQGGAIGGLFDTIPTWAIVLGGGVVALMLLGQLTPLVVMAKSAFGPAKKRSRSMAGHRRLKR